ncbi:unnamed protein product, partial [Strongylus vulgaris]
MNLALISGGGISKIRRPSIRMCNMTDDLKNQTMGTICGECSAEDKQTFTKWAQCPHEGVTKALFVSSDTKGFCYMAGCNDMAVIDDTREDAYRATLIEMYDEKEEELLLSNECT